MAILSKKNLNKYIEISINKYNLSRLLPSQLTFYFKLFLRELIDLGVQNILFANYLYTEGVYTISYLVKRTIDNYFWHRNLSRNPNEALYTILYWTSFYILYDSLDPHKILNFIQVHFYIFLVWTHDLYYKMS